MSGPEAPEDKGLISEVPGQLAAGEARTAADARGELITGMPGPAGEALRAQTVASQEEEQRRIEDDKTSLDLGPSTVKGVVPPTFEDHEQTPPAAN